MKEGYKTSELYVTLAATIIGLLQVYGVIDVEQAEAWQRLAAALVGIILTVLPAVAYITGRTKLKVAAGVNNASS